MLPKAPDSELRKDSNPLIEALFNYQLIHIEAYVVHVDLVSQNEVAFKLTPETIESLVDYHKDIYSVDASASTYNWPEKETQVKKMQEDFVQAANRFVFRTGARALEGMEEDGAGELLEGRSENVKQAIMNLFTALLPPPPRIVDVVHPAPLLPNHHMVGNWGWHPQQSLAPLHPVPVESWRVLPSTPSPTATTCSDHQHTNFWHDMNFSSAQLPSPTPSYSHPIVMTSAPTQYFSSPECLAPLPTINFPSMPCGIDIGMGGYNDFGWSQSNFAPQYATTI